MKDGIRDLFMDIMNFKPSRRTLKWELAYWGQTAIRWYDEGLKPVSRSKEDIAAGETLLGPGIPYSFAGVSGGVILPEFYDVSNYFNLDSGFYPFPYQYWFYPLFKEKVIYEDEVYVEKYGIDGIRIREPKDKSSMPMWLEFPVKDRNDWETIKRDRLNINSIKDRYIISVDEYLNNQKAKTYPRGISDYPCGFFGSLRTLMGDIGLFYNYHDNPSLIHDICSHLCNLWLSISEELTSSIDFDYAIFFEDMAGKQGSLISPDIFKEFMTPYYKKIIDYLKSKGVKLFIVDTDGKVDELIPLFLDLGMNSMLPFERQAGNDIIKYRKLYPELRIMGGFDKNTLFKGKDAIDKELEKEEWLITQGGYVPYADHSVPPNASWENFKYYRNKLNKIIENTKVTCGSKNI
jgi:hypothetical protein